MKTKVYRGFAYAVVHSPDDGGYYGEVFFVGTGETLAMTETFLVPSNAERAAMKLIDEVLSKRND